MVKIDPLDYFYSLIKNKPTVPRWFIFILDLAICAVALLYAYSLRFSWEYILADKSALVLPVITITGLNIIFFGLFRTHEGIIRLSSAREAIICVSAVFSTSFVILLSIGVSAMLNLPYLVPSSVNIIYFFTASFLIFTYRLLIKELYHRSLNAKLTAENVIIYGDSRNGALLKKAIESIVGRQYKIVAFVDSNEHLWGKSIDSIKIYSFQQVRSLAIKCHAKYIFLASDEIEVEEKNNIADFCLANNIGIKTVPGVQKWVDGQLQTRQIKNLEIEDLLNRPSIKLAPEHVQSYLTGKRVLITGAAGSIGSEIVKQVAGLEVDQLILCDNRETGLYELQHQLQHVCCKTQNIVVRVSNIRHRDTMESIFRTYRPQIVFHAAAYKHVPLMEMHPCEAVMNNVLGTRVVADLAVKYDIDRFVFISTDKAINPTNVMGASKRIAEMYVAELQHTQKYTKRNDAPVFKTNDEDIQLYKRVHTKFITTRFGNVLGSNGSVIPRFQEQIDKGGPVTVTHPEITRFFMTIPEACSLVLEAGTMGKGGEVFVFDMGDPVKIVDLATKMIKLAGLVPGRDIQIEFTGLRPGEKLYEELLNKSEEVIPTHHKKIMISRVNNAFSGANSIADKLDMLIDLASQDKNTQVVKQMKVIVREFVSNNSVYQKLDAGELGEMNVIPLNADPKLRKLVQ